MTTWNNTWHHIRRSPYQSLTAILVIFINIFTISIFLIASLGFSKVISYYEAKPEITIFLKDGLDKDKIESIQRELATYSGVKEIRFISKEKALENYREQNKNKPILLEMVTASILPSSFEVTAASQETLGQISQSFSVKKDIVDEVIYPEDIIRPLLQVTDTIKKVGLAVIIFLTITSFLIVSTTVGQKIRLNKEEIKVSRLLGASRWYITSPFIMEGMFYGLVGALVAWLSAYGIAFYFRDQVNSFFDPIIFFNYKDILTLQTFALTLLASMSLGFFSANFGAKRQIKF